MENVVIIGTGCAGLTSAIYTARANLEPLIIEGDLAGGQLSTTTDVENYPGFPEGIMGPVLTDNMRQQATRFGARVERGYVTEVKADTTPFQLVIDEGERTIEAKTVIMSAGASPRYLGLESERQLLGYGRLEDSALVARICTVYKETWGPLHNFFLPCLKLKKKWREGSHWRKRYELPTTAYDRLRSRGRLSRKQRGDLREIYQSLDPFELKHKLEKQLKKILSPKRY